jgi:mannose-6-phosphate isomerase-like protein (cupin superfamily)
MRATRVHDVTKYTFVDVDDLPAEGPGGAVRKLRRALGAQAFGFNHFQLGPGVQGIEHDETESSQEEVMFVVAGSGRLRVDGDEIDLKPGRFVRLDPSALRQPVAGPDGLTYVTFGSPVNERYEPPSWG